MTATKVKKLDLLEHFYNHLNDRDWLEGVDLYQSGKVIGVANHEHLLVGSVQTHDGSKRDVRLKMHPNRKVIQWMECTCKKNRTHGAYCEHLAAFIIHAEREQSQFFSDLDTASPIKPPSSQKRLGKKKAGEHLPLEGGTRAKASQTLLQHLQGSIHGLSFSASKPKLKVKIELKPGSITSYELDLDGSAQFIRDNKNLASQCATTRDIASLDITAEFGIAIRSIDTEKIVVERVVGLPCSDKRYQSLKAKLKLRHQFGVFNRYPLGEDSGVAKSKYILIPYKSCDSLVGQEYFFMTRVGFTPVLRNSVTPGWFDMPLTKQFRNDQAAQLVDSQFRDLLALGTTWIDPELDQTTIVDDFSVDRVKVHTQHDGWFFLDPRYGKGKATVSMTQLMHHYKNKKRSYFRQGNTWIKIPEFIRGHDWQLDSTNTYLKVDTLGLLRLKAMVGQLDQFAGSKKILDEIRQRTEFENCSKVPPLKDTKLTLRSYQLEGLKWLWWLYQNHLHGLLADDMGLGKTHQAMAIMSSIQSQEDSPRFLVICPTTVLDHWENKISEFAPNLKPIRFHGPKRIDALDRLRNDKRTLITSYGILLRDIKRLSEQQWEVVILDEAHFVKNNNTSTYRAACVLRSRMRLCLTGTPLENHLGELKNIFDFLVPGYLGSDEYFRKNFQNPIEQKRDPRDELALQRLVYPLKLRRTKSQVLTDLPAKIEDVMKCSLSEEQIRLYRDIVQIKAKPLLNKITDDSEPIPYLHVFALLQLLKQVCDHPMLVAKHLNVETAKSGKFELLKELLREALASNNKVVIFSQYIGMIDIISDYCAAEGISSVTMTGQTRDRGKVIERFQNDSSVKVFIGSLLAGGIGIDLTAASVVIHYDRWWNASKENQATDRVHRIGQDKFVQVFKLVTKGTLEEKIDQMIERKQIMFSKFLEKDEEIFKKLSRQDLIDLLDYH